jgi:hypothetical protein
LAADDLFRGPGGFRGPNGFFSFCNSLDPSRFGQQQGFRSQGFLLHDGFGLPMRWMRW